MDTSKRTITFKWLPPEPPPFEKLNDPDYSAVTDDGTQNIVTDLLDKMAADGATALAFVSRGIPRYKMGDQLVEVPDMEHISLDELMEDLAALGIVYNAYRYLYTYKPQETDIEEMSFVVDTYATPGVFSAMLMLEKKTYKEASVK